jgi:hypothetical protein
VDGEPLRHRVGKLLLSGENDMHDTIDITAKGRRKTVPAWHIDGVTIIQRGKLLKKAEIFDEYWLERETLPSPESVIETLRQEKRKPDLFTFAQRIPDIEPRFGYHMEWNNVAAIPISSYDHWFQKQISSATRRNIRASKKKGVEVRVVEYDDACIRDILLIINESPIRHRKRYWHYGEDFETIKRGGGTYANRSTILAAYYRDEMIGYLKIVWDKQTAAVMQILSKIAYLDFRPNNALLSEAVRQCCSKGVNYLLYEKFIYDNKTEDSLTKFKQNNGFVKMDVPRYYVPLTNKGLIALRFGFHKNVKERLPEWIIAPARNLRTRWYEQKLFKVG